MSLCWLLLILNFFDMVFSEKQHFFTETVGKVIMSQRRCVVLPVETNKRFANQRLQLMRQINDIVSEWIKVQNEEQIVAKVDFNEEDGTACFRLETPKVLKMVAHSGEFVLHFRKFQFFEIPKFWISGREEDDLDSYQNINLDKCRKLRRNQWYCLEEEALAKGCRRLENTLENCEEKRLIEVDSSDEVFTYARQLEKSYVISTKAKRATILNNGNIFQMKSVELPKRIFQTEIPDGQIMSIGNIMFKHL